eukprot:g3800.t1
MFMSVTKGGIAKVACCPTAGMEWVQGRSACQPCEAGKYSDKEDGEELYKCVACAAGKFSEAGPSQTSAEVCKPCAAGTYSKSPGQTSASNCTKCGLGLYSNLTGQSAEGSCKVCVPGQYANASGQHSCKLCSKGRAVLTGGNAQCSACDPGRYQDATGQATCLPCAKGEFQNATGATSCRRCEAHRFANETAQTQCHKCPIGKATATSGGSSSCQSCGTGKFGNVSGAPCEVCPPGRFREHSAADAAGAAIISCDLCPSGWYQADPQKGFCQPCTPGKYQDQSGHLNCKRCKAGRFNIDVNTTTVCKDCSDGTYSLPGAAACLSCPPGMYGRNATGQPNLTAACQNCTAGFYSSARASTFQDGCTPCSPGRFSKALAANASSACAKCDIGMVSESSGAFKCLDCKIGKWTDTKGSAKCASCAAGQYGKVRGEKCALCREGRYRASSDPVTDACRQCPLGETTLQGEATCRKCEVGMFGDLPGHCTLCKAGQYNDGKGETECKMCPADTWGAVLGATSNADCFACPDRTTTNGKEANTNASSCMCAPGFYYKPLETDTASDYAEKRQHDCLTCPTTVITGELAANCTHAGETLGNLASLPGYWRESNTSNQFYACVVPEDCAGGIPGVSCREGHMGPLCAVCAPNFVRIGGACSFCDVRNAAGSFAGLGASIVLLTTFVLISLLSRKVPNKSKLKRFATTSVAAVRMKRQAQIAKDVTSSGGAASLLISMGKKTLKGKVEEHVEGELASASGDDTGDIVNNVQASESMSTSLFTRLRILIGYTQIFTALNLAFEVPWPPAFLTFLETFSFINLNILDLLAPLNPCALNTPFLTTGVIHMFMLPLFMLIVLIARGVTLCVKGRLGAGSHRRPTKENVNGRAIGAILVVVFFLYPHMQTAIFMFVCGAVYILGIPVASVILLWHQRKFIVDPVYAASKAGKSVRNTYGSLYTSYDRDHWYFESVEMIKKMTLAGGLVLVAPGSSVQIMVGILVALGFLVTVLKVNPYEDDTDNNLQIFATLQIVLTLLAGLALKTDTVGEYEISLMSALLILINASVIAIGILTTAMVLPLPYCKNRYTKMQKERNEKKRNEEKQRRAAAENHKNHNDTSSGNMATSAVAVLLSRSILAPSRLSGEVKLKPKTLKRRKSRLTVSNIRRAVDIQSMHVEARGVMDCAQASMETHRKRIGLRKVTSRRRLQDRLNKRLRAISKGDAETPVTSKL